MRVVWVARDRISSPQALRGAIKTVGRAAGPYGVRRQAKRDAALACVCAVSISRRASQAKAASRFACRRTPHKVPERDRQFTPHTPLLPNTKLAENHIQQIFGGGLADDFPDGIDG